MATIWTVPFDYNRTYDDLGESNDVSLSYNFVVYDKPIYLNDTGGEKWIDGYIIDLSSDQTVSAHMNVLNDYLTVIFQPIGLDNTCHKPVILNSAYYSIVDHKHITISSSAVNGLPASRGALYLQYVPYDIDNRYTKLSKNVAYEYRVLCQRRPALLHKNYIVEMRNAIIILYQLARNNSNYLDQNNLPDPIWSGGFNNATRNSDPTNITQYTPFHINHVYEIRDALYNFISNFETYEGDLPSVSPADAEDDDFTTYLALIKLEKYRNIINLIEGDLDGYTYRT